MKRPHSTSCKSESKSGKSESSGSGRIDPELSTDLLRAARTRQSIVYTLKALENHGLLTDDTFNKSASGLLKDFKLSTDMLCDHRTPYGKLLQRMWVGDIEFPFIHPLAWLRAIGDLNKRVGQIVTDSAEAHVTNGCLVVLYVDECHPGNAL